MKRKILSILMIVVCLACFSACNLVETDTQKDYKRTVATVTNSGYVDEITKLQLVNAVVNNYSTYVSSYGYTVEELVDAMMNSLVQRRIVLQEGVLELTGMGDATAEQKKETLTRYLKGTKENNVYTQKASDAIRELLKNEQKSGVSTELTDDQIYAVYNTAVNSLNESFKSVIDEQVTSVLSQMGLSLPEEEEETDDDEDKPTQRPVRTDTSNEIEAVEINYPEDKDGNVDEAAKAAIGTDYAKIPFYVDHLADSTPYVTIENEKEIPSTVTEKEVRQKAINKVLSNLENNYSGKDEYTLENFYEEQLISQLENGIITRYQEVLDDQTTISYGDLKARYEQMVEAEKNQDIIDPDSYETRLSSVSDTSFVLYHPVSGYGYVKHILLKFDAKQDALLAIYKNSEISQEQIEALRDELLADLTVKDLTQFQEKGEITYKLSDDTEGKIEYVQYATVWDTLLKLLDVDGSIVSFTYQKDEESDPVTLDISGGLPLADAIIRAQVGIVDDDTVDEADYAIWKRESGLSETVTAMEFYNLFKNTFGSTAQEFEGGNYVTDVFKTDDTSADMVDKFIDWIFRFNEDDGMFNNTTDYLSTPKVDVGESETFVTEFAEAARAVVDKGVGAYTLVPSDYGYHLVICTEKIVPEADTSADTVLDQAILAKLQSGEALSSEESSSITAKLYNVMISERQNVLYENTIYAAIKVYESGNDADRKSDTTTYKYRYQDLYNLGS